MPGAAEQRLPIVGDPLGLLSRPAAAPQPLARPSNERGDPGALMASTQAAPEIGAAERDPRAVARGLQGLTAGEARRDTTPAFPANVQEKSAAELIGSIRRSGAKPHVLFLYASYCRACRDVLPSFLPLVQQYRARGVQFTAASIDRDVGAFEGYAPVLGGVLPALLIRSEGVTRDELVRAGLKFSGDGFSIPLVAVFDKQKRLLTQGGSATVSRLPQVLDGVLVNGP